MQKLLVVVAACVLGIASAVEIRQCGEGKGKHNESDKILVSSCPETAKICTLKKKTDVNLEIKFTAPEDIKSVDNSVHAKLFGVPFPFIGVDGTSICGKIFNAADGTKEQCPLKAGQEYVYKDSFRVQEIYPKVRVDVHWSLAYDGNTKSVMCFEIPAKIVS